MSQLRLTSDKGYTHIFIDGVELKDVMSYKLAESAGENSIELLLTIKVETPIEFGAEAKKHLDNGVSVDKVATSISSGIASLLKSDSICDAYSTKHI